MLLNQCRLCWHWADCSTSLYDLLQFYYLISFTSFFFVPSFPFHTFLLSFTLSFIFLFPPFLLSFTTPVSPFFSASFPFYCHLLIPFLFHSIISFSHFMYLLIYFLFHFSVLIFIFPVYFPFSYVLPVSYHLPLPFFLLSLILFPFLSSFHFLFFITVILLFPFHVLFLSFAYFRFQIFISFHLIFSVLSILLSCHCISLLFLSSSISFAFPIPSSLFPLLFLFNFFFHVLRPPDRKRRDLFGVANGTLLQGASRNITGMESNITDPKLHEKEYPFSEDKVFTEFLEISNLQPFTVYRIDIHACNYESTAAVPQLLCSLEPNQQVSKTNKPNSYPCQQNIQIPVILHCAYSMVFICICHPVYVNIN